jgi:phosphoribosyl 1,2-cyclic phosphodiesterase
MAGLSVSVLGSSSKGNSTLVYSGDDGLLFDAGLPVNYMIDNIRELDVNPGSIKGILISHEHKDHIKSAAAFSVKFAIPVYVSQTTFNLAGNVLANCYEVNHIKPLEPFFIGDYEITPFPVPHDAAETLGFRIEKGESKVALATDIGKLTTLVKENMQNCDVVVIESNYDKEMLMNGPYPPFLKQRIISQMGHFSNADCLNALKNIVTDRTRYVVLAHLSEENNDPYVALKTINEGLGQKPNLDVSVSYPRKRAGIITL